MERESRHPRYAANGDFEAAVERSLRPGIAGMGSCAVAIVTLHPWWIADDWMSSRSITHFRQAVSTRLASLLVASDSATILRQGEWALLLSNIRGPGEAREVGRRLTEIASEPVDVEGQHEFPLISTGIAVASGVHRTAADLIADAKVAVSQAVESGAGTVAIFDEDLRLDLLHRCRMVTSISRDSDISGFDLHYQPIVDVPTGRIAAVEALLRWPGRLPIGSTAQIISLAERTNLIEGLGSWILDRACHHAALWAHQGVVTHINLSPIQLLRSDLVEKVRRAIEQANLHPEDVAIEITESATMKPDAISNIAALKDLGVGVALDDFGTGYANLASLRALPIDALKVDRSIIAGATTDSPSGAMLEGIAGLSHALNFRIIAEGIETKTELAAVTSTGFDLAQGYLIQRPGPAEAVSGILDRRRRSA